MDCKTLREILDLYVDGELSAEATAAASTHIEECLNCREAKQALERLRRMLRDVVRQQDPPKRLLHSVRRRYAWRRQVMVACLLFMVMLASAVAVGWSGSHVFIANALEAIAFRIDTPHLLALEGTLICRDCELRTLYGVRPMCERRGHRGAVRTADGKIWNLMESPLTDSLIYDHNLHEKKIHVRGRLYRRAGYLEVESYEILGLT